MLLYLILLEQLQQLLDPYSKPERCMDPSHSSKFCVRTWDEMAWEGEAQLIEAQGCGGSPGGDT
eukprot:1142257-Pelagomonas_calceolata.AAC.3